MFCTARRLMQTRVLSGGGKRGAQLGPGSGATQRAAGCVMRHATADEKAAKQVELVCGSNKSERVAGP